MVSGGSWAEITRTAASAVSFTDLHRAYNTPTMYRVRAFKTITGSPAQYSGYSNQDTISLIGIPWIRVTAPVANESLKGKSIYTVKWTANLIGQVRVLISFNQGKNWVNIHPQGGISLGSSEWSNFAWTVPDTNLNNVSIKVVEYNGGIVDGLSGDFSIVRSSSSVNPRSINRARSGKLLALAVTKDLLTLRIDSPAAFNLRLYSPSGKLVGSALGMGPGQAQMPRKTNGKNMYLIKGTVGGQTIRMHTIF